MNIKRLPIIPLPSAVISKIAAGEVIDRPATVVKELVENALDAHAYQITIELEDGGKSFIRIIDDGQGIPAAELKAAASPHSTSKLRTVEDFQSLLSFGFRGEALASIAEISQLTLRSRIPEESVGAEVVIRFGELLTPVPELLGMPTGTVVQVEQLFTELPARKKFLKSASIERSHIIELITQFALAHPEVGFFLKEGHETLLAVTPKRSLLERTIDLFGSTAEHHYWSVSHQGEHTKILGLIGQPNTLRPSQNHFSSYSLIAESFKQAYFLRLFAMRMAQALHHASHLPSFYS
jgi:DNA mismatch repair protein MutL